MENYKQKITVSYEDSNGRDYFFTLKDCDSLPKYVNFFRDILSGIGFTENSIDTYIQYADELL